MTSKSDGSIAPVPETNQRVLTGAFVKLQVTSRAKVRDVTCSPGRLTSTMQLSWCRFGVHML